MKTLRCILLLLFAFSFFNNQAQTHYYPIPPQGYNIECNVDNQYPGFINSSVEKETYTEKIIHDFIISKLITLEEYKSFLESVF